MRIGFIGGGNMARALLGGALRTGRISRSDTLVSEPDAARRAEFAALGTRAIWDNAAIAAESDLLILAVKPQRIVEALDSICSTLAGKSSRTLVVSIAAGTRTDAIEARLPAGSAVVRVMPNTPLLVGAGMSVLCSGAHANEADLAVARELFAAGGETLQLPESLFDAVTAVSGSGPAYFFLLVEQLAAAGAASGLPPSAAELLARQTFVGAARLMAESSSSLAELRAQVTSPGGTTAAALAVFDSAGFGRAVSQAVAAAVRRGAELATASH